LVTGKRPGTEADARTTIAYSSCSKSSESIFRYIPVIKSTAPTISFL